MVRSKTHQSYLEDRQTQNREDYTEFQVTHIHDVLSITVLFCFAAGRPIGRNAGWMVMFDRHGGRGSVCLERR